MLPQMSQSFCGQSLISTQATYFFTLAGQTNSLRSSTISHCIGIVGYLVASGLLEVRFLRSFRMLVTGQCIMVTAMLILAVLTTKLATPYILPVADVILSCICFAVFGSAVGPGAAGWAYIGESSSARLRGKTSMWGVFGNTLIGASMSTAIPYMLVDSPTGLGVNGVGFFFFAFGVTMIIITVIWLPDYSGLS
ncbi:MFS general substrate transporter [Penicillium malachiteum]|nr:MFS general substrate transporter [Penicillium malachiteum]